MNSHQRRIQQRAFTRHWDRTTERVKQSAGDCSAYCKDIQFYSPHVFWNAETAEYLCLLLDEAGRPAWGYSKSLNEAEVRYAFDAHEQGRFDYFQARFPGLSCKLLTAMEYGKLNTALNKQIQKDKRRRHAV